MGLKQYRAEIGRDCSSVLLPPSQLTRVTMNRSQHQMGKA
jgi:hypothetical protein